uniref:H-2 class II histocompatibility antigen, E-S beta chain n=1 Tax=Oreochromis niloticus TaxID=8128 RepID=A0A669C3K7_ORENI
MASSFLCFTLLFISIHNADGFLEYIVDRCDFNSTELENMEYIYSHYYNKMEYIRFSSNVGQYVGFTDFGVRLAEVWNNDTADLNLMRLKIATYCHHNIDINDRAILTKSVQPSVRIKSMTPPSGQHPAMLVCSVYDFFPSKIKVSWLRDGQAVSSDITSTEEMPNGDWYYQTHSQLEYTPRSGEKISCVVEHASLKEPLITDWGKYLSVCLFVCTHKYIYLTAHLSVVLSDSDPSSDKSTSESTTLIAIGASILTLGLILLLAGFIFYRWRARGQTRIHTLRPVNSTLYQSFYKTTCVLNLLSGSLKSVFQKFRQVLSPCSDHSLNALLRSDVIDHSYPCMGLDWLFI